MTANRIHLRVASNEKILKKHRIKKATSSLTMIPLASAVQQSGSMQWETKQAFDKRTQMNAMIHPCLYLIQIVTEWGIIPRQMVCARAGYFYFKSIHWYVTVPTTFTVVLKSQVLNDLKSQQKTWERPPIMRWESGLLRLYIAPVSAYRRCYDT